MALELLATHWDCSNSSTPASSSSLGCIQKQGLSNYLLTLHNENDNVAIILSTAKEVPSRKTLSAPQNPHQGPPKKMGKRAEGEKKENVIARDALYKLTPQHNMPLPPTRGVTFFCLSMRRNLCFI